MSLVTTFFVGKYLPPLVVPNMLIRNQAYEISYLLLCLNSLSFQVILYLIEITSTGFLVEQVFELFIRSPSAGGPTWHIFSLWINMKITPVIIIFSKGRETSRTTKKILLDIYIPFLCNVWNDTILNPL